MPRSTLHRQVRRWPDDIFPTSTLPTPSFWRSQNPRIFHASAQRLQQTRPCPWPHPGRLQPVRAAIHAQDAHAQHARHEDGPATCKAAAGHAGSQAEPHPEPSRSHASRLEEHGPGPRRCEGQSRGRQHRAVRPAAGRSACRPTRAHQRCPIAQAAHPGAAGAGVGRLRDRHGPACAGTAARRREPRAPDGRELPRAGRQDQPDSRPGPAHGRPVRATGAPGRAAP